MLVGCLFREMEKKKVKRSLEKGAFIRESKGDPLPEKERTAHHGPKRKVGQNKKHRVKGGKGWEMGPKG